jgi:putative transcriptional regulator
MGRSYAGDLLVSRPDMSDPNFDGTLTFVLEHGDDGAVGIMLNRPSGLAVSDAFPGWSDLTPPPSSVFVGGPVQTNAIIALGRYRSDAAGEPRRDLPGGLASVDLDEQPALALADGLTDLRIFAGYAGWGAGQLEGELANDAWWVVPGFVSDVFTDRPETLWAEVLRRNGGELRWFAHLPLDPSSN